MPALRIVGPGRAGTALARALQSRGWTVAGMLGRGDDLHGAAADVDVCVISTPDAAVASAAASIAPNADAVVMHLSGSLPLDALGSHPRRASLHPLVTIPDAEAGAHALPGAWFAVSGDPVAHAVVADLGGRRVDVDDAGRAAYHAAACIASNHLVALLAQVERVAAEAGVPFAAFVELVRMTVDNVASRGPAAALTGPVARGDWATVERHLAALPPSERDFYLAGAARAAELAGRQLPGDLGAVPCR
jgi:predicted short-subunit dehydrogenase-like oxidoreductase (DUF2520 family)